MAQPAASQKAGFGGIEDGRGYRGGASAWLSSQWRLNEKVFSQKS